MRRNLYDHFWIRGEGEGKVVSIESIVNRAGPREILERLQTFGSVSPGLAMRELRFASGRERGLRLVSNRRVFHFLTPGSAERSTYSYDIRCDRLALNVCSAWSRVLESCALQTIHYRRGVLSPLREYDSRSANSISAGHWIPKQFAYSSIVPAVTELAAVSYRCAVH
jgi:hypothetical protein